MMKKIFAIYCTINLVNTPEWLNGFRDKYDEPYDFHIALKQMAYINEQDLPKIKDLLEVILKNTLFPSGKLHLEFNRVQTDKHDTDDGSGYIYVFADQRNESLDKLQKIIRDKLSDYSDYYFKDSRLYEFEFKPHLTIARNLEPKMYDQAVSELPKHVTLTGNVTSIVLSCVKELSLEEANKRENFNIYPL